MSGRLHKKAPKDDYKDNLLQQLNTSNFDHLNKKKEEGAAFGNTQPISQKKKEKRINIGPVINMEESSDEDENKNYTKTKGSRDTLARGKKCAHQHAGRKVEESAFEIGGKGILGNQGVRTKGDTLDHRTSGGQGSLLPQMDGAEKPKKGRAGKREDQCHQQRLYQFKSQKYRPEFSDIVQHSTKQHLIQGMKIDAQDIDPEDLAEL